MAKAPTTFEYEIRVVSFLKGGDDQMANALNRAAMGGWVLVTVVPRGPTADFIAFFQRLKK